MGYFLAVSAFKVPDPNVVVEHVIDYCTQHGVKCAARGVDEYDETRDAIVFPAGDCAWTRVLWPAYFNMCDFPLCRELAAKIGKVVSTVHVYDGDYWEHLLVDHDQEVHRFSSWPHYFAESEAEAERLKQESKGDVMKLATLMGIAPESVAGYMVHMPISQPPAQAKQPWWRRLVRARSPRAAAPQPVKAYPDDECELDDIWVFTDFWKRIGIVYPDPANDPVHEVLRLDPSFVDKLPS